MADLSTTATPIQSSSISKVRVVVSFLSFPKLQQSRQIRGIKRKLTLTARLGTDRCKHRMLGAGASTSVLIGRREPGSAGIEPTPTLPRLVQDRPYLKRCRLVRLRPFLAREVESRNGDPNPIPCISILDGDSGEEEISVFLKDPHTSRNKCYKLDSFFGQDDNNVGRIFYNEVCRLIPGIFLGHNATVFAYGATGSGKTYTMEGTEELPGLMPLAMSTVLSMCQCSGSLAEISYYEVYMDRCFDLLEPKENEIVVLDDEDGQIHLRGLSRDPINSMSEFHGALLRAIYRRKVGHTSMNDASSRSHGVLVISVPTPVGDGLEASFGGKLNLIDLAGNEDNRRTCNEGMRLQESAKINQSLFALSNVIYALNNNKPRVLYRESKLTRILQDSLGGTSHALMVACLETPKVKVDMEAKLRAWLQSKGKTKRAQRMGSQGGSPCLNGTPLSVSSVNRKGIFHSNVKAKINAHKAASSVKNRAISGLHKNLFRRGVSVDSRVEISDHQNAGDSRTIATNEHNCSTVTKDGSIIRRSIVPKESFDYPIASSGSLAQEFIDFLNPASQEELVEIKGIGLKRAKYIIELRETSPLKSLNDLEKMGLSSKQVQNMFNRAARGLFVV